MLYKFGTVEELERIKAKLPKEIYQAALNIVTALDDYYGAERDVGNDDGGFVLIIETVQDIVEATEKYIQIDKDTYEYANIIRCSNTPYVNVLYLNNNEFSVNVFLPKAICPKILLADVQE